MDLGRDRDNREYGETNATRWLQLRGAGPSKIGEGVPREASRLIMKYDGHTRADNDKAYKA